MKAAVNGKYVVWWEGRTSVGVPRGGAENVGQKRTDETAHPAPA